MKIETEDYTTWISHTGSIDGVPFKDYENEDGRKWRVFGTCNACGMCEDYKPSHFNIRHNPFTGLKETYTRYFTWTNPPGTPGACIEKNYENRKDIPMTPDCINDIKECVLTSKWIENGN